MQAVRDGELEVPPPADRIEDPNGEVKDDARIAFYEGHIRASRQAMEDGVDLVGFFPWSLMDNYEWAWGYGYRFGMYYVDYATQVRTPKRSAMEYAAMITSAKALA